MDNAVEAARRVLAVLEIGNDPPNSEDAEIVARALLTATAEVERMRGLVQRFLNCPEIADCHPEDKDGETHQLEHDARAALSPQPPKGDAT